MSTIDPIFILDGAQRTPRADILINNKKPGLFSNLTTTQLGGLAIRKTLEKTEINNDHVGHVIMGIFNNWNWLRFCMGLL